MVNVFIKLFLKIFFSKEKNRLSPFCRDFASKEELKHELELFLSKTSKTSNKTTMVDHSDSEKESTNEEFIYGYVCDNTTKEEIYVEKIKIGCAKFR